MLIVLSSESAAPGEVSSGSTGAAVLCPRPRRLPEPTVGVPDWSGSDEGLTTTVAVGV